MEKYKTSKREIVLHNMINKEFIDLSHINMDFNTYTFEYYLTNYSVNDIVKKYQKIFNYRKLYNVTSEGCLYCKHGGLHSITYLGLSNYLDTGIIYINPSSSNDKDINNICQHLLSTLEECFKIHKKVIFIFNLKYLKDYVKNLKISKNIYEILNNCFYNEISEMLVINPPKLLSLFTKLFCKAFNNKISVIDQIELYKYCSQSQINYIVNI